MFDIVTNSFSVSSVKPALKRQPLAHNQVYFDEITSSSHKRTLANEWFKWIDFVFNFVPDESHVKSERALLKKIQCIIESARILFW